MSKMKPTAMSAWLYLAVLVCGYPAKEYVQPEMANSGHLTFQNP